MLPAANRLRRRDDFAAALRDGRRARRGSLVVHLHRAQSCQPAGPPRVGLVVSRAVGDAVTRNTVRRRLRHLLRDHLSALPSDSAVVVRALPTAAAASYRRLGADLAAALAAASRHLTEAGT